MAYSTSQEVRNPAYKSWVLVVEDEPDLLVTLLEGLEKHGFRVAYAQSSSDAVIKLQRQHFDCIMLDLRLLKGTGEKVIKHLGADRNNQQTPVLVMSAYLDAGVVNRLRGRVQDILVKPFHLATLVSKVEALLAQRKSLHSDI